jgi:replication factor A1
VGSVEVVVDKNRVDGSRVRLAEVLVGDETGCVSLRARDEQIDILKEVSQRSGAVVLRNSTLELFQGRHIRLAVTKWGKMSVYPDQIASTPAPPQKMNMDRNFSMIDLVRVASTGSELVKSSDQEEHHNEQSYQQSMAGRVHMNQSRRGGGNRRNSPRGGSSSGYSPQGMLQQQHLQQQLYADATALQYPPPGGLHGYGTRYMDGGMMQQYPAHHMMQHHGYDAVHTQMPMYHLSQGRHHVDVSSAMSAGPYRQDMHGNLPQSFMTTPAALYSRDPNEARAHNYDPTSSPRMNPRATTFDPAPKT